jgi:carboxyl-terminal processing protease
LVVLINKGSASASEILSGSLRDHKRAKLVGEKTFGKGSVQEALDIGGGAGLHVTIAKWILPNGDWINSKGIEPNVKVELKLKEGNTLTRQDDNQLDTALEVLIKNL